jgi:hypothetical protein
MRWPVTRNMMEATMDEIPIRMAQSRSVLSLISNYTLFDRSVRRCDCEFKNNATEANSRAFRL